MISRVIEIMLTIPTFFLIIAIIAFRGPSIYNIMVVIGLTGWMGVARFVRAEFLKLKQLDFITALRALGASNRRIIFMHMLPNAMAPVLVSAVFGIAGAILTESSLSFLGFGVPAADSELGRHSFPEPQLYRICLVADRLPGFCDIHEYHRLQPGG